MVNKGLKWISLILIIVMMMPMATYGSDGGEMGVFGGISEGTNLPYTMDKYVDSNIPVNNKFSYQEYVFISGKPILFTGDIIVEIDEIDVQNNYNGIYNESYTINASSGEDSLKKSITFETRWYKSGENDFDMQVTRVSEVEKWSESITIGGNSYTLNEGTSFFSKSSTEDITPGVSYYDTDISYTANYIIGDEMMTVKGDGDINGYSQPWSKAENQNLSVEIYNNDWQMSIIVKPFQKAKKTIYFDENKTFPTSIGGTYIQRFERDAAISYEIIASEKELLDEEKKGQSRIVVGNRIEKLPITHKIEFLYGHWAEDDVKKLYSMNIFTDIPREGMQYEAMTRGEYVKALCLAMAIDTSKYEEVDEESPQIFDDVETEHSLYKYIMAAYDAKLIKGVGSNFNVNLPITRQEAFVIYIRVIGLERLGITNEPVTPFIDDADIADWARKEIMAGYNLGIIKGTAKGEVLPNRWINKAEAAAIINRLIDYLREEISRDYK